MTSLTKWLSATLGIALFASTAATAGDNKTFVHTDSADKDFTYRFGDSLVVNPAGKENKSDEKVGIKELQGKWRAIEQQTAGIFAPKEVLEKARLEIKDDQYIWRSGGPVDVTSRFRLDPSKSPKEIDITMLDGPGKGTTFPGIYALEKGQLRICYSHTKDRPKEFKTKRGESRELIILEREKSTDKLEDK